MRSRTDGALEDSMPPRRRVGEGPRRMIRTPRAPMPAEPRRPSAWVFPRLPFETAPMRRSLLTARSAVTDTAGHSEW